MENLLLTLNICQLLALGVVPLFLWKYLPSYLSKKAENLATKEDIGEITRKVEEAKYEYTERLEGITQQNRLLLEHIQYKNQLRLAALDRRLQAHQEAYTLWRNLVGEVHNEERIADKIMKCQDWWVKNSLYLDAEARQAFHTAYMSASTYCSIYTELRQASSDERKLREDVLAESWKSVNDAGEAIVKAVELPSLGEEEHRTVNPLEDGRANTPNAARG